MLGGALVLAAQYAAGDARRAPVPGAVVLADGSGAL